MMHRAYDGRSDSELLSAFAHTLSARRSLLTWRSFVVAASCAEAKDLLIHELAKAVRPSASARRAADKVGFLFTGQGAQWSGMGRELIVFPVFRESLEAAEAHFKDLGSSWSMAAELFGSEQTPSRLSSASVGQPICTALQVALTDLLNPGAPHQTQSPGIQVVKSRRHMPRGPSTATRHGPLLITVVVC